MKDEKGRCDGVFCTSEQEGQTRRSFLKAGCAGAAFLALPSHEALAEDKASTKRYGMVINLQNCIGCGSCILACKNENNVQSGALWSNKINRTVGKFPNLEYEYIPTLCNHCSKAPCVEFCPTGAIYKGEGDVTRHTPTECIGCQNCIHACPYDVIYYNDKEPHQFWRSDDVMLKGITSSGKGVAEKVEADTIPYYNSSKEKMGELAGLRTEGIVEKCTLCDHRIFDGADPYCVDSCPAGARIFGDLSDPKSEVSILLSKYKPWRLKEEEGTEPKVCYIRSFRADVE